MLETKIAPGLLLSMPHLMDPNFTRAVVLMIEHNEQGSFGLIINHPSEVETASLLDTMDIKWQGENNAVIWSGGPVMPTSGWILHHPMPISFSNDTTIDLIPGLALSTSEDSLRYIAQDPPEQIRVLLGYSGWGPGQLASEMARGSWLHAEVSTEIVFDTKPGEMWERALRSTGIRPEQVIQGQGIH